MNDKEIMTKYGDGIWIVNGLFILPILGLNKHAFVGGLFLSSINFILALLLFIISWFDIRGYGKMHEYLATRFFALALLIFFISLGAFIVALSEVPSFSAP